MRGSDPATKSLDDGSPKQVRGFRVTVVTGPVPGAFVDCPAGHCTIGSLPDNLLQLDDDTVSRYHCELVARPGGVSVRDLESKNGTLVDGLRVMDARVRSASLLRLGRCVVRVDQLRSVHLAPAIATSFGRLTGVSVATRTAFAILERAATTDTTVLLEGETGTGKEGAARGLHELGPRRAGPFLVLDCGSVPANLMEDELFGHEKGAYTGADERRPGIFEAAAGGSVLLDEIGELPLELQPKLLRVLEQREVRRLGATAAKPVDVRVVAATNRDLRAEVNAGTFRADLYYRLAVVRVALPPLRERPVDLQPIIEALLVDLKPSDELRASILDAKFLDELAEYSWPGNVRELRNFLEQCTTMGAPMSPGDPGFEGGTDNVAVAVDVDAPYREARQRVLDQFDQKYVSELLQRHRDNVSAAARHAGLSRVTLYALMKRHGLRDD